MLFVSPRRNFRDKNIKHKAWRRAALPDFPLCASVLLPDADDSQCKGCKGESYVEPIRLPRNSPSRGDRTILKDVDCKPGVSPRKVECLTLERLAPGGRFLLPQLVATGNFGRWSLAGESRELEMELG